MLNPLRKIHGVYTGALGKETTFDVTYLPSEKTQPVLIFCHGFKGFKDWGGFNYVAEQFALAGIIVFKINFSHNGTRIEDKENFSDLESFSKNTLGMEMDDIAAAETYITEYLPELLPSCSLGHLYLLGHSKGGVSCILHAAHHVSMAKKIITWGTPFNFFRSWSKQFLTTWREKGIQYILNGRTRQQMPLSVSLLDDFEAHRNTYDMALALPKIQQPLVAFHGTLDESVPWENAHEIAQYNKKAQARILENANHTFGMTHPFSTDTIPDELTKVIQESIQVILND
ncbi:MAG: hypothetical protein JNM95_07185 [Chitinophagaceae bacterium]|nr:hypothetical protein [Chitinophagaceae bacterium]